MRIRRHLTALLATVMVSSTVALVGVATTAPASAATATQVVSGTSGKPWIYPSSYRTQPGAPVYGSSLSLSINVKTTDGTSVYDGTLKVQRQLPGQSWTTIKSSSSAYIYDSIKAAKNANYRAVFTPSTPEFAASSSTKTVKVQRKITYKNVGNRKVVLRGKVSPKTSGSMLVYKQSGKTWKRYKAARLNSNSVFQMGLPAPRKGRYYWKLVIPAGKGFVKSQTGRFYTYSY